MRFQHLLFWKDTRIAFLVLNFTIMTWGVGANCTNSVSPCKRITRKKSTIRGKRLCKYKYSRFYSRKISYIVLFPGWGLGGGILLYRHFSVGNSTLTENHSHFSGGEGGTTRRKVTL